MTTVLFKFCTGEGAASILTGNSIFVTSPLDLNDPFEMRPGWTDDHERRFFQDQQLRSSVTAGLPVYATVEGDCVRPVGTMPHLPPQQAVPVDSHRGLADRHNSQVFRQLHLRFRVLSLVADLFDLTAHEGQSDEHATLMWSHYADQFQGICLALDTAHFDNGVRTGGFPVQYRPERQSLPPSYYDCWQALFSPPSAGAHQIDPASGLYLTAGESAAFDEHRFLELLLHKAPVWQYEHEVRMIYDVLNFAASTHDRKIEFACQTCSRKGLPAAQCTHASYRDVIDLPPEAVRAVIFGADCPVQAVQPIVDVLGNKKYRHVDLYWSCLHSSKYLVQYMKGSRDDVQRIQMELAKQVAFAKNHYCNGQLRLARKGINYVQNRTSSQEKGANEFDRTNPR